MKIQIDGRRAAFWSQAIQSQAAFTDIKKQAALLFIHAHKNRRIHCQAGVFSTVVDHLEIAFNRREGAAWIRLWQSRV